MDAAAGCRGGAPPAAPGTVCWFCRRGRCGDCMSEIPVDGGTEGPHDCTFDTRMVPCACRHGA